MIKTIGHGHRTILAAALATLAGLSAPQLMASTVKVGTCDIPGVTTVYTTIQSAVTAVSAGSTIDVCPGNYPEQVVIEKNLTLTGFSSRGAANPVVVIPAGGFVANTTSLTTGYPLAVQILVEGPIEGVDISKLAVDGTGSNLNSGCTEPALIGIYYRNASGTVNNVVARNQAQDTANFGCQDSAGLGIFVESGGSGTSTVTIENSSVHGYQKNGITADETGTTVTIDGNSVMGTGSINTAQNGIQVGFGATGTVENNTVSDDIFNGNPSLGTGSGILIYDSGGMTITGNTVSSTQNGIPIVTDGSFPANHNMVTHNRVTNTQLNDGIDLCSNNNTAEGNIVDNSGESGIHLDSTCGATGNNNVVSRNTVHEACAGILLGSGTGNTLTGNTITDVTYVTLPGNVCASPVVSNAQPQSQVGSPGHSFSPARP